MSTRSRQTPPKARNAVKPALRTVRVAPLLIGSTLLGTGLGTWLLALVWPVDPDQATALAYGVTCGLFSGLLGGAATAGSLTMSSRLRWLSPIAGLLFAVGFTGLVLASMGSDSAPWLLIGVTGIAACVIWFYVLGMVSGVIPPLYVRQYGTWTAPAVGAVLVAVGLATSSREALVLGVLTIAAWVGIAIGSAVMLRRSSEQATQP